LKWGLQFAGSVRHDRGMTKTPKRPRDVNQLAKFMIDVATEGQPETTKKQLRAATAGRKGGPARSLALTPEQRSEIARVAAAARWKKA
jgi:hypothetical protein